MRLIATITVAALSVALLGPAVAEDAADYSYAQVYCVAFTKSGDATSQALEKAWLTKLRDEFADKDVLFLSADMTSRGSKHQAQMLLNALSMENIWRDHGQQPGSAVLVESEWGRFAATLTSKTTLAEARAAIKKALEAAAKEDDE
jgi:hypothetical protein